MLATAAKLPEAEPIPAQKPREKVTINDILARRAKAGKLVAGTAAYSDSDMFKAPVRVPCSLDVCGTFVANLLLQSIGKPKAKRWDRKPFIF